MTVTPTGRIDVLRDVFRPLHVDPRPLNVMFTSESKRAAKKDEAPTPKGNPSGPGPRFVSLALAQLKATLFDALDRTLHVHELYRKRLLGGGSALLARESHVLRQLHVHDSPAAIDVEHDLSRDLPLQELPDPPQGLVGKAVDHALVLPRYLSRRARVDHPEARLAAAARAARHRSRRPSSVPSL